MSEQTDTIEAVARCLAPLLEGGRKYDQMPANRRELKIWNRAGMCSFNDATQEDAREAAEQAIAAHTKALVDGAGELCERLLERTIISRREDGSTIGYEPSAIQKEAAATISALRAENEQLLRLHDGLQDVAQGLREQGVRAGIEAAAAKATGFLVGDPANDVPLRNPMAHEIADAIRALDAAAIARRDSAMADLIAGDAHLIDTVGDSDGDDGA